MERWRDGGVGEESGMKLASQCCSHHRITAISEPSCVECCDDNTIVGAWDEARQRNHLSTH